MLFTSNYDKTDMIFVTGCTIIAKIIIEKIYLIYLSNFEFGINISKKEIDIIIMKISLNHINAFSITGLQF